MLQALERGFGVSKPFGDSLPYDVIVDSAPLVTGPGRLSRVQVRCTHTVRGGKFRVYLTCCPSRHILNCNDADFLAAFVGPYDAWYIIPLSATVPRGSICLFPQHPNSRGHFEPCREAWDLLVSEGR
jgi:PD-(D/E)XK nuclease superfamily protein